MNYLPRVNFDDFKDRYESEIQKSISFIGQSHDFFTRVKVGHLLKMARRHLGSLPKKRVLDIGCGVGVTDRYLKRDFNHIYGVDIGKGIIGKARKLNPQVSYRVYDGKKLPFKDNSMDLTFAICVLHHVPPGNWTKFFDEMKRVTKKGGLMLIFEHNPWNPLTRLAVNQCDLDEDAILLRRSKTCRLLEENGIDILETRFILFTAFGGAFFRALDHALGWIPFGAQYYVAGRKQ